MKQITNYFIFPITYSHDINSVTKNSTNDKNKNHPPQLVRHNPLAIEKTEIYGNNFNFLQKDILSSSELKKLIKIQIPKHANNIPKQTIYELHK
jgi:hypothetical protein